MQVKYSFFDHFHLKHICISYLDGYPLDGRDSPDVNHWNSINSGGDMDIDR